MTSYSAGVLIFIILDGEKYFLLGRDSKYHSWSDFGGKAEFEDGNNPLETASREFYEETGGVVMSKSNIYSLLKSQGCRILCTSYRKKKYYMYLLELKNSTTLYSFMGLFPNQVTFLKNINDIHIKKFIEKDELQLFTLDDILTTPKNFRSVFHNSLLKHLDVIRSA